MSSDGADGKGRARGAGNRQVVCTARARRCVCELRLLGKGELSADHASQVVRPLIALSGWPASWAIPHWASSRARPIMSAP
jgi:hypothetical protein